ncbi:MAG TPA: NUDIX hydrolase [Streptosporangiaceae bacterium]
MNNPAGAEVRCSAVVFRDEDVLLVGRVRNGDNDWVLPGGTPRPGESMAACARRETREETGLTVEPGRIAFVLETRGPRSGLHTVDLVFLATLSAPGQEPRSLESDLSARFVPLGLLDQLDLRPPMAGHLRSLHGRRTMRTAPYLGNLWRPRRREDVSPVLLEFADEPAAGDLPT